MSVVLGPGWPGVLLHEAVGHGLEGDFNRKGSSTFAGRIGQRVAAKGVTVLDDGTLPDRRGSLNVDDEGHPTQRNVLIEDGILKGYIQDSMNARLMSVKPTGNGRRESYAHVPMPRMTNTYMLGGDKTKEEIVASLERGLYATNFGGGQVDITSGKFVFSASEAFWVENGKIQYPVKGATLIGNGPDALTRVSMIGNDMTLDTGVGVCGKEGQSVPVGVGQPTLRIDRLTVGGTGMTRRSSRATLRAMRRLPFFFAYFWFSPRPAAGRTCAPDDTTLYQKPPATPAVFSCLLDTPTQRIRSTDGPPTDQRHAARRRRARLLAQREDQPDRRPTDPGRHAAAAARAPDPLLPDRAARRSRS